MKQFWKSMLRNPGTRRTSLLQAPTASATDPVVLDAYCGYSGTIRIRAQPALRNRSSAVAIDGAP